MISAGGGRSDDAGTGIVPEQASPSFSVAAEDALHDVQRATHLIPRHGFGLGRRLALLIGITWLPLVAWAATYRRIFPGVVSEPILEHFGVHTRFLVAVPLLVIAEPLAESVGRRLVSYFQTSGLVPASEQGKFAEIIRQARGLMRSRLALAIMAILVLAGAATTGLGRVHLHELAWATDADHPDTLSFGGLWFVWVSRPIYTVLVLNWLWRLAVTAWLLGRVARLDLQLVPTHPDRCGGLGFLQRLPTAFAPLILAASCVLAARWGHDVLYHNVSLASLQGPAAVFLALALLLGLGPLLAFAPRLAALKRESLLTYGALVGRHGRLVRERWIRGKPVEDDGLLEAPELGPVADTLTLYEAVAKIRPVPIGRQAVLTVAAAALIPMIAVVTIKIPLKQQIMALGKVLM